MEKIMSETTDTSDIANFEQHDLLADSELDAVTGGFFADLVRQSIQLANEAQYQMMVNSIVAGNAATNQSIIANIR
jgi:hypothetical protein